MAPREPNAVETTPSGIEIAFYDSVGVDGEKQQRRYLVDGERVVSVTTALGALSKGDALIRWALNLERKGEDWREVRDEAARRGTAQHHLLLRAMLGERTSLGDLDVEHRVWGQAAYRWLRDREPEVVEAERMVACPLYRYAGRFDLLSVIDGELTIVDFKTISEWKADQSGRRRPPYAENLLQLDLYAAALPPSGYEPVERGLIVRLGPDGTYDETFCEINTARGLDVLGAYESKRAAERALRESAKAAA